MLIYTLYGLSKEELPSNSTSFFAICGFIAAFTLSIEKLHILQNPNQVLPCDISSIFNCQTVMKSPYANLGNIPYSFFGVAGYPAVMLAGLFLIQNTTLTS
ncbi:MAG: hypothetical protein HC932_04810 [Thermales bacterium]|nr:hypothetical protein [Thermales bacterium]